MFLAHIYRRTALNAISRNRSCSATHTNEGYVDPRKSQRGRGGTDSLSLSRPTTLELKLAPLPFGHVQTLDLPSPILQPSLFMEPQDIIYYIDEGIKSKSTKQIVFI